MLENTHKEASRRLNVDDIPRLGSSHVPRAVVASCGCGVRPAQGESGDTPRKYHTFAWTVARAVVGQVVAITRAKLWLVVVVILAKGLSRC
jgi:hypothetical protein